MSRSWAWRFADAAGRPVARRSAEIGSRFDAELWLGENWRALAAEGAVTAQLFEGGEPVGAPVPLRAYEI